MAEGATVCEPEAPSVSDAVAVVVADATPDVVAVAAAVVDGVVFGARELVGVRVAVAGDDALTVSAGVALGEKP